MRISTCLVLFALVLSACAQTTAPDIAMAKTYTPTGKPAKLTSIIPPTLTPVPSVTATSAPTETPLPSVAPTSEQPQPTVTPTLEPGLPAAAPPVVAPGAVISRENDRSVVQLAGWGAGFSFDLFIGNSQLVSGGKMLVQKDIVGSTPTFPGIARTRFWDLPSGQLRLELVHPDDYEFLYVSPDGARFAIFQNYCHRENPSPCSIEIWSFPENKKLLTITSDYNMGAAFSHDNRLLAFGTKEGIAIWDLAAGKLLRTLPFRSDRLVFSHDDNLLVSYQYMGDGKMQVWQVQTGELAQSLVSKAIATGYSPDTMAFSPDDAYLATAYGGSAQLWKVDGWSEGPVWRWSNSGGITKLAYSPDGRLIAASGTDGRITLADAASGEVLANWDSNKDDTYDYLFDISFSADGKLLITISMDQTLRFWGIKE